MTRLFLILFVSTLFVGCAKTPEPKAVPVKPIVEEKPKESLNRDKVYDSSFIRGYHDGYDGNWLAPLNWVTANEYRAGWSAGNRDKKSGYQNFFNN